jgi:hypothetical protein
MAGAALAHQQDREHVHIRAAVRAVCIHVGRNEHVVRPVARARVDAAVGGHSAEAQEGLARGGRAREARVQRLVLAAVARALQRLSMLHCSQQTRCCITQHGARDREVRAHHPVRAGAACAPQRVHRAGWPAVVTITCGHEAGPQRSHALELSLCARLALRHGGHHSAAREVQLAALTECNAWARAAAGRWQRNADLDRDAKVVEDTQLEHVW